ncbi:polysaccharide deacetylase family protein [Dyadobacter frigoris]|uniref:NodB homology domain-containing protein n=1 Tax=Dyadobacter frigoris TaxID=2576211 RepID=A0A4U6D093_9BACT|nr:polysaccharide deacetylase family protein [Dyadobacter frigoris]TKT90600.1 hypothetical protein FDK13_19960 [Dyadobacter frigoris]GLU51251.1 hypothetical protein Dfri01_07120 [Dyadobacter frigoris]
MKILVKIKAVFRKLRYIMWDLIHFSGLANRHYKQSKGCRILLYHGVCSQDPTRFNTLFVTKEAFENHLKFYKKYFNVVSLEDFYAGRFATDRFNICLTLDDGFANNYHYVLPLLVKYQIPATFFITAIQASGYSILWNDLLALAGTYGPEKFSFQNEDYYKNRHGKYYTIDGKSLITKLRSSGFNLKAALIDQLWPLLDIEKMDEQKEYWIQMREEQIQSLSASPYALIGSHGYYHNDLSQTDLQDATKEIVLSKQYLENLIGKEITSFAFPYGSYHGESLKAAKNAGYKMILATDFLNKEDHNDDFMKERLTINPFISTANQLFAIIKGNYA